MTRRGSTASFGKPQCVNQRSAWLERVSFAFWIVDALRPTTCVEFRFTPADMYLLCRIG